MNVTLKMITLEFRRSQGREKIELAIEVSKHLVFLDFLFKDSRLPFILTAAALKEKKKNPPTSQVSICNFSSPWRPGELCGIFFQRKIAQLSMIVACSLGKLELSPGFPSNTPL